MRTAVQEPLCQGKATAEPGVWGADGGQPLSWPSCVFHLGKGPIFDSVLFPCSLGLSPCLYGPR